MPRGRRKLNYDIAYEEDIVDNTTESIDVHVGKRIAARRKLLQMSQKTLAEKLGVTFQQVQKYEKGVNRIGAGRMYSIALILGVDVSYFFTDIDINICQALRSALNSEAEGKPCINFLKEDKEDFMFDPLGGTEAVLLLKAFYSLPARARTMLLQFLASVRDRDESSPLEEG